MFYCISDEIEILSLEKMMSRVICNKCSKDGQVALFFPRDVLVFTEFQLFIPCTFRVTKVSLEVFSTCTI